MPPTPDPVADAIEALVRAQRRNGFHDTNWTPIRAGQCCLCGREGRMLPEDITLVEASLTRWMADHPDRQKLIRKLARRVHACPNI
jgi:hypothetical protein